MAVDLGPIGGRRQDEWPATMDVAALVATGWRPPPFREFVLKIHSRCDLACHYCYMYTMADQSWRDRPLRMAPAVIEATAARIAEHAAAHGLPAVDLILHGGEPLLAGPDHIASVVTAVRAAAGHAVRVRARVQTNAVILDARFLRLFDELGILVGVSLDGDRAAHDRHRRRANGTGSYDATAAALRLLGGAFPRLFSGLLCTIDPRNDPVATYEALLAFHPPRMDFLLPLGTWAAPPPGRDPDAAATPYADWLIAVFDRWYHAPAQETVIRLFAEIIQLLLGGASASEVVGLTPAAVLVIETDGSIEHADVLKSTYPGASTTGLHVFDDPFDKALLLPTTVARQLGERSLAAECRACRIRRICGGGLYSHRYRPGRGFHNPSVYCPDLYKLITHIRDTVAADLSAFSARLGRRR